MLFHFGLLNLPILSVSWLEGSYYSRTFLWYGEILNEEHFTASMASAAEVLLLIFKYIFITVEKNLCKDTTSLSAINKQTPKCKCKSFRAKKYTGVLRGLVGIPVAWSLHSVAWLCFFNLVISVNICGFKRNVGSHSKSWGFTGWSSKWYSSSSQQLRWLTENIWKQRYKHGVRSEPEQFRWEVWRRIISLPIGPVKPRRLERKTENKNTLIFLGLLVVSKEGKNGRNSNTNERAKFQSNLEWEMRWKVDSFALFWNFRICLSTE